jgi:hypothetical protein
LLDFELWQVLGLYGYPWPAPQRVIRNRDGVFVLPAAVARRSASARFTQPTRHRLHSACQEHAVPRSGASSVPLNMGDAPGRSEPASMPQTCVEADNQPVAPLMRGRYRGTAPGTACPGALPPA